MKKNLLLLCFLFFEFVFPLIMKGEGSFYFRHFGVENGLPQNTVSCILQDKQGFMWFGTKDGLSRYDGYAFRNFKYDRRDKNSIGNNFIRSLYQTENEDIWVGTDAGLYIYHPSTESFSHFDLKTSEGLSIEGDVNCIKCDGDGNLWIAGGWQGVFVYKAKQKKLISYYSNSTVNAWNICIDREKKVWIGTGGHGLCCYDPTNGKFETIMVAKGNDLKTGDNINRLFQDNYNDILIGTANGGLKKLSLIDKQIKPFLPFDKWSTLFVRDILRRSDNELWIATESGVFIYNTKEQTIENLRHENTDTYSLSDNAVYCLYKDREGGMWIGTYFGGVNYYPAPYTSFKRFYPLNKKNSLQGKRVREFQPDQYGGIWIGTEDEGLNYYNPHTNLFENFLPDGKPGSLAYFNIHGLLAVGDKLWVGTFTHGLDVIDIKTRKVIRHYQHSEDTHSLCDNSVFSIYKDHSGNLWIGTINGLQQYDPVNDNFIKIDYPGDIFVYDIFQSNDGMIWFASFGQGLFRYNPRNNEWKVFRHDSNDETSICHKKIISIFEDSKKTLWFTTEGGGISKYNPDEDNFTSFTTDDGLPNNVVYKILEDENSQLWLTTNRGLSRFNPESKEVKTYTLSSGLLGDQFNYKSGYKAPDGTFYFGCMNGFIAFTPSSFLENKSVPPVVFTDFQLFNRDVKVGEKDSPLNLSISYSKTIELKYNQSSFSIGFAALSYTAPEKNEYVYILEGFEKEWNHLSQNHNVTYSNIPPGKYIFRVKASNSDGVWNNAGIDLVINISPPFYETNFAYFVYIFCLFVILFFIILSYKRKLEKRNQRKLEILENEKDKELYNAKIAFFTNIAHEIRTPLSLIKGPLEHILSGKVNENETKENLEVIEKNTNRLLDLSNQLLDFRKMEAKGFQLNYVNTDIKQLIQNIYVRFKPTATQKHLDFDLELPIRIVWADVDREAITKILSNLFTNAIKHAASRIVLILEDRNADSENKCLIIKVVNDGQPIPKEMNEKIFEAFFQIGDEKGNNTKGGTGLGLPLARSLAELHHGELYVDNSLSGLNTFVVKLPFKQEISISIQNENKMYDTEQQKEEIILASTKPTVLVVEDDPDLRHFLFGKLKSRYNVIKASNGIIALEKLRQEQVDVVITDIMMPVMDGLQLCEEIKSKVDYSHIPVILLTAKAGIQSRIEGLEIGADAYVEKPFSMEYLLVQISNLFTNRNKVKQAFINSPIQSVGSIALTKSDENFLEKVTQIIHKNLSETSLNVDFLADGLHMSRSSLHRKIKGISELTPNDFIQLVRLKKAAEFLHEGSYRINEICFLVGFSSSSYFSKSFKKQFGISPKEFIKKKTE